MDFEDLTKTNKCILVRAAFRFICFSNKCHRIEPKYILVHYGLELELFGFGIIYFKLNQNQFTYKYVVSPV